MGKVNISTLLLRFLTGSIQFSNAFTFDMITLAALCCTAVQEGKAASARTEKVQIKRPETITTIKASAGGSMRATLVCLDPAAQTLVISFRGTKVTSPVDWMTNANGDAVSSKGVCFYPADY